MATAVIQCGVAKFVCIFLADPLEACSSDPCRRGLHVEELAALFEALGHGGTHQVGRHQQGEGE